LAHPDVDSRSDLNSLQAIPCSVATSEDFCPNRDLKLRIRESAALLSPGRLAIPIRH